MPLESSANRLLLLLLLHAGATAFRFLDGFSFNETAPATALAAVAAAAAFAAAVVSALVAAAAAAAAAASILLAAFLVARRLSKNLCMRCSGMTQRAASSASRTFEGFSASK